LVEPGNTPFDKPAKDALAEVLAGSSADCTVADAGADVVAEGAAGVAEVAGGAEVAGAAGAEGVEGVQEFDVEFDDCQLCDRE